MDLIIDLLIHLLQLTIRSTLTINVFIFILFDLMVILGNGSEPNWMDLMMTGRHLWTLILFQQKQPYIYIGETTHTRPTSPRY